MRYLLPLILACPLVLAEPPTGEPARPSFEENIRSVFHALSAKATALPDYQKSVIQRDLDRISRVLSETPEVRPFRFELQNDTLMVYDAKGSKIAGWSNHDKMEIKADVLLLVDKLKEAVAYKSDGTRLLNNWKDVKTTWLKWDYIGLLDNAGVFEAFSTKQANEFISNWKDTIKVVAEERYIALLDSKGIFEGYLTDGKQVVRVEQVKDIERRDEYSVTYTMRDGAVRTFPIVQ